MSVFEESASYKPFKYPVLVEATKRHLIDMHWTEAQVELQDDLIQYLSKDGLKTENVSHERNKYIFDTIVCLFTELDKAVASGYASLIPMLKNNEVRSWLFAAASRETTHQRGYALAAETFGFPSDCWVKFKDYVEMTDKLDVIYGSGDEDTKLGAAKLLARILLGEGIGLFAAFACLLNFKRSGLFMGFNDVNSWSLLDEQEHVVNNMYLLNRIMEELTDEECLELNLYIVDVANAYHNSEKVFIDLVFAEGDHEGLTKGELLDYIDYLTDLRLYQLGVGPKPEGGNPLEWMDWMLTATKHDNFFEKKVTAYSHEGLVGEIDYTVYAKLLDEYIVSV